MKIEKALELRAAGRLVEALEALGASSEFDPRLSSLKAEIEFALGRFEDAALNYFAVTMADPDNADLQQNLALCLACCERWDLAAEAFERVLRLDAERVDARLGLGSCLLHLNRAEEALVNFTRCGAGMALFGKAVALQSLQRFEEAGRMYETWLAVEPDSEEALSNLIAMSIERRDWERTSDYAARLLEICPQSTVALQGLATAAFGNADHPAAAAYCDQILEWAPDRLEAWHNFRVAMDQCSFSAGT
ncbi:MAG: tetratricopeptide repeat protein [Acidobacteriota bacterium]|nr:tetratricopeptide repeat protein [Acidobacteriota bacterium]